MHIKSHSSKQKGFTLIEIAIVLVIIGLIVGGALKGQDVLERAKFKSFVSEFQTVIGVTTDLKERYGIYLEDSLSNLSGDSAFWQWLQDSDLMRVTQENETYYFPHALDDKFTFYKTGTLVCAVGINQVQAFQVDIKLDDGLPNTGKLTLRNELDTNLYPSVLSDEAEDGDLCIDL